MAAFFLIAFLGCAISPIPPVPPVGCKAMVPVCVCDVRGDCHWVFECVQEDD